MIQMIGDVIIAATGLRKSGYLVEADKTLRDALLTIMPEHADLVDMVDETTAITLLGDWRLVEIYIELLLERAELKIALEEDAPAEAYQQRAIRIFIKSLDREPRLSMRGLLICGRLAGLELHLLLDVTEIREWEKLQRLIETGGISFP